MFNLRSIETKRLQIQNQIDSSKTSKERNKLGQFATPTPLAIEIVVYTLSLLPSGKIRFLDPAIGTGSFFSALATTVPVSQIARAIGYEVDPLFAKAAQDLWIDTPLEVFVSDFSEIDPPSEDNLKPNIVICNPPYVRHHHLSFEKKRSLHSLAFERSGIKLSGLAGLYCYFLLIAHGWMGESAVASWIIPSEFMDVNYGQKLKEYLLDKVTLIRVHRFDPNDLQFGDALVASSVLWFRKTKPTKNYSVEFTFGGTISKPLLSKSISSGSLRHSSKWSNLLTSTPRKKPQIRLTDLFEIRRGVATGSNGFFILTAEKASQFQVPSSFLTPILPGPRYLQTDEILADEKGNPIIEKRLFLFSSKLTQEEIKATYPTVWHYLLQGMKTGIHERYLCSHRSPWYSQETRKPTPFLCTYMGRRGTKKAKPFRFILNHSNAIAPNVYLMLYPKPKLESILSKKQELAIAIWQALNGLPIEMLIGEGRVYGDGLHKLEPKELANMPADRLLEFMPPM